LLSAVIGVDTAVQELSPLKNVEELAVPVAESSATPTASSA
jgi:hypothetical protein